VEGLIVLAIVIAAFLVLGLASAAFGADSRDSFASRAGILG
jgi:hypothetical protein